MSTSNKIFQSEVDFSKNPLDNYNYFFKFKR